MNKILKYSLFALTLALGTSTFAHAHGDRHNPPSGGGNGCNPAPEVDPNMAVSGLSLLGGTIAVVRARRK